MLLIFDSSAACQSKTASMHIYIYMIALVKGRSKIGPKISMLYTLNSLVSFCNDSFRYVLFV